MQAITEVPMAPEEGRLREAADALPTTDNEMDAAAGVH